MNPFSSGALTAPRPLTSLWVCKVTWPSTCIMNIPLIPSKAALSRKKSCLSWVWGTLFLVKDKSFFQLHESWVWGPLFKLSCAAFCDKWDFCFVLFCFLAEEIKCSRTLYGGLYLRRQRQPTQEVQMMSPRMGPNKKTPPPSNKIENIMLEQKMQGMVLLRNTKLISS